MSAEKKIEALRAVIKSIEQAGEEECAKLKNIGKDTSAWRGVIKMSRHALELVDQAK